jgi:hypothetical protein
MQHFVESIMLASSMPQDPMPASYHDSLQPVISEGG